MSQRLPSPARSTPERLRGDGGKSFLNPLLSLIFFALLAWVMWVLVPVQWANYQFEQAMQHEALYAGPQRRYANEIQRSLLLKAAELKLPVSAKGLKIVRTSGEVEIEVQYEVPVSLFGFTYKWKCNPKVKRAIYYY